MTSIPNPFLAESSQDPYPIYKQLREQDPVSFLPGPGMWFLSRHADCVAVLRDPRFSAGESHRLRQRAFALAPTMLTSDPPEHTRLRHAVAQAWNPASLQPARRAIGSVIDRLLAAMEGRGELDLIADYAAPVAARALAAVLGIPDEDCAVLHGWLTESSGNVDPMASPKAQERGAAAAARMKRYFGALIAERREAPQADILSSLARTEHGPCPLSTDEILETCNLLAIGGYEPLANLIGNGMLALLRHPGELDRLREDPALAPRAIEELLRFDSPVPFVARIATEDVLLDGRRVRRGQPVIPLLGAANRDPAVFQDPDRLELSRSPNPHLTFGAGHHACFGALFTRFVAQLAVTALVRRFPDLHLATDSLAWRPSMVPRGLRALPVTRGA